MTVHSAFTGHGHRLSTNGRCYRVVDTAREGANEQSLSKARTTVNSKERPKGLRNPAFLEERLALSKLKKKTWVTILVALRICSGRPTSNEMPSCRRSPAAGVLRRSPAVPSKVCTSITGVPTWRSMQGSRGSSEVGPPVTLLWSAGHPRHDQVQPCFSISMPLVVLA